MIDLETIGENDLILCFGRVCKGKKDLLEWIELLEGAGIKIELKLFKPLNGHFERLDSSP